MEREVERLFAAVPGHTACVEMSLRRLGLETIDLRQPHRVAPQMPLGDQVGELSKLRYEGKIRHLSGIQKFCS